MILSPASVRDLCLWCAGAPDVAATCDAGWDTPLLCYMRGPAQCSRWWGILGGALAQGGTAERSIWRDTDSEVEPVLQDGNNMILCMFCVCFVHAIEFRLVWS